MAKKKKTNEGEIQAEEFLEKYESVLTKSQKEMIEELMTGERREVPFSEEEIEELDKKLEKADKSTEEE
jgi:hypothetical protein